MDLQCISIKMEATKSKRIAVIGGGVSGMGATIILKDEGKDLEPVCFEKTDKYGGTWCYREESVVGVPSIMPTTTINHSKEFGAISLYPPDKKYSNYMPHKQIYEYFTNIANERDIYKHIRYNTEVIEVKRAPDYDKTGKWVVTTNHTLTGVISSETFDGVVVASGHINIPKYPSYKGQENFKGQIIHTHGLKEVTSYKNKNVVVVGMGCSGLDAAVDISTVANQVYLSTRSGAHVINRVGPHGLPFDYVMLRRYILKLFDILPTSLISWVVENSVLNIKFDSNLFAVKPKYHLLSKDPILNDQIGSKLLSGVVVQKRDIVEFLKDGVIFEGDVNVTKVDAVIMATGYKWEFPFLEKGVLREESEGYYLYKCVWPTELKHSTLGFVGFILPWGAGFPLGELQCRYISQVMSGHLKLPSEEKMIRDVEERLARNKIRYSPSSKQTIRVDFMQYGDEIASLIGAKPNLLKLLFTDPHLCFKLIFGPCVPYQYRLQGPHSWSGAREAIMNTHERVIYPLTRSSAINRESRIVTFLKKILYVLLPFT